MAKAKKQDPKNEPPRDPLDTFEDQCAKQLGMATAMLLWKNRFRNPEMAEQVTVEDIEKLTACVNYLGITPKIVITRPRGRPAQAAVPERAGHRAIPAKPAEPDRPFVMIQLVDEKGDHFKAIENAEDSAKRRDESIEVGKLRDRAPQVAGDILAEIQSGTFVDSTLREAARMLTEMAKRL